MFYIDLDLYVSERIMKALEALGYPFAENDSCRAIPIYSNILKWLNVVKFTRVTVEEEFDVDGSYFEYVIISHYLGRKKSSMFFGEAESAIESGTWQALQDLCQLEKKLY